MSENAKESEHKAIPRTEKGYFIKGQAPKSPGRPKGSISIKDAVRKHLEEHPEDFKEYVEHFIKKNRELSWQMLEGRPQQDITSAGEKIVPVPILGGESIKNEDEGADKGVQQGV